MQNSTEGVFISGAQYCSISTGKFNGFDDKSAAKEVVTNGAALLTLPTICRQMFVKDVKTAVGDINAIPQSIKPKLQQLLKSCDTYIALGNEKKFLALCGDAVTLCGQGWSYLSYWTSTEQSICYSIYWSLKAAIDKHHKDAQQYLDSKNDGLPKNDIDLDKKSSNLNQSNNKLNLRNIRFLKDFCKNQKTSKKSGLNNFLDALKKSINLRAEKFTQNLMKQLASDELECFAQLQIVKIKITNHPERVLKIRK